MGLLTGEGGEDPRFIGPQATSEYNALFGVAESGVPVEGLPSGPGSADSHWRESVFGNEIMTPALGSGTTFPLSRVTIAALADMGYEVDMSQADAYSPSVDDPPIVDEPPVVDEPSVESSFDSSTGRLRVSATEEVEIAITAEDGTVRILVDNESDTTLAALNPADVQSIVVEGSGGDDRIDLSGVTTAAFGSLEGVTILGGDGNDTILGSDLADLIDAGNGNDSVLGDVGVGVDNLTGTTGDDTMADDGTDNLVWL